MDHFGAARRARLAVAATVVAGVVLGGTAQANAGLVGSVICPVVNTLTKVTSAGWDDGATTSPTTLDQVAKAIGAQKLYASGISGAGIGVAVVDSGAVPVLGLNGPGKVINGPDLSFESQQPADAYLDTFGHGTHLAGIIAGNDGTSGGFAGVAPGAHLVEMRVASHDGAADVSQVVAAIDWAVQHRNDPGLNIRVLNLSYGTASTQGYQQDPIAFAVENAWRHGIVTVVAGGNDGTSAGTLRDPAVDPYVLAVGAADLNGSSFVECATVAPFSSRGSATRSVDLVTPGVSIESLRDPGSTIDLAHPGAVVDTRFFRGSGTSQAAAVASGAVALLLQARPNLTPDEVKGLLRSTATPLALLDGNAEGAGMLQIGAAAGAFVPLGSAQTFPAATGAGSLELARGGSHVAFNNVELTGEQDIMASPWRPATWVPASTAASAWNGGIYNGNVWTGSSWASNGSTTSPWTGATWTGATWTGATWTGATWTGATWTSGTWW